MYRGRPWTMRQYAGFGTAEESNRRYKFLLASGQTGLSVAFDLPTQMGRDSDHPLARGEVGRIGVAIESIDDMHVLLDGLPLDQVSTSMTINATAATLLALYDRGRRRARHPARRAVGDDPERHPQGVHRARDVHLPAGPVAAPVADTFAFCQAEVPRWNTISISGYHIREAGSDAVQEVAFTLADGIAYVEAARAAGLAVDDFAPRLSFFFNAHTNLLEEVAKFRAARRLWARIMRDRFGAKDPRAQMLRFHAQTAGSTLTARAAAEQHRAHDDRGAGGGARRRAVAAHERLRRGAGAADGGVGARRAAHAADPRRRDAASPTSSIPLGGAYAIEALTSEIEARARRPHRGDRSPGRHGRRHRGRLPAARDRAPRPGAPAGRRARRARRRRRKPLHRRGRRGGRPRCTASIPRWRRRRSRASRETARHATEARRAPRSTRWLERRAGPTTWSRRFSPPSRRVPRSAKSPTCCATCSGNIDPA